LLSAAGELRIKKREENVITGRERDVRKAQRAEAIYEIRTAAVI
jgi:hypothetical protein